MKNQTYIIESFAKNKGIKKAVVILIGILTNTFLGSIFDYLIYPLAIWRFGLVGGGLLMTFIGALICYLLILFYDYTKQDWLGIEILKRIREYTGNSKIFKIFSSIVKKSDFLIMIFLSVKFDPLITTIYMRKGIGDFNGMKRRDWMIFFGSVIVGNIYWTFLAFSGVSFLKYIFQFF